MKTAHDDKKEAETIRYLRDCGYTQKAIAEAMETHPTQVCRIAYRHNIEFERTRREPPNVESGVYTLGVSLGQWKQIGAEVRRWYDLLGSTDDAEQMAAASWNVPVGAVRCWTSGEHHRLD